ncbi:MAG: methyltransferase [Ilyomonas sp.]
MEQSQQPDPAKIMQIGMGFWASKVLLVAVKLQLFTKLASGNNMTAGQIKNDYGFKTTSRHVSDWLDTLTTLGFLKRDGVGENAVYSNSSEAEIFLDKKKQSYIGGILEMANNRLYSFWGQLEEALQTGMPQNETKGKLVGEGGFEELYRSEEKLQEFMDAMSGIQTGNFMTLAKKFDFGKYKTVTDIGGADAWLSIILCQQYPHLHCISFDLPPVEQVAKKKIAQFGLTDRIKVRSGNFSKDEFPSADIITMGNILHGLNETGKQEMVNKVYKALPSNGVFITIENIIDDERKQNLFGLLMSLNMLIENGDAFDYTVSDFERWTKAAGFSRTQIIPLTGPASAGVAYKG